MNLETPVLLVAMPQVLDPFFHMSVVLLVQHESEDAHVEKLLFIWDLVC